jgi:transcriptional regulator GlxA family with amidase domain
VCAGVFLLAEAGLLTGRRATTHWTLVDQFRRRFPRVILEEDALVIEDQGFLLGGGGGMTAYFDIGLRLVQKFAGPEVASDCAAIFLLDPHRKFQSPFVPAGLGSSESDPVLARALDWVRTQPVLDFGVQQWAAAVAMEKRTLERRAKAAWGFGPAERLRRLRLDRARMLLSEPELRWDDVANRCGYRDAGAFRRLFLQRFGQAPGEYRRRFG